MNNRKVKKVETFACKNIFAWVAIVVCVVDIWNDFFFYVFNFYIDRSVRVTFTSYIVIPAVTMGPTDDFELRSGWLGRILVRNSPSCLLSVNPRCKLSSARLVEKVSLKGDSIAWMSIAKKEEVVNEIHALSTCLSFQMTRLFAKVFVS